MSKLFFLVDPVSGDIRRQSDDAELNIVLTGMYRRHNPPMPPGSPPLDAEYATKTIAGIMASEDTVFKLTEFTSVCYREPPKEERPRS